MPMMVALAVNIGNLGRAPAPRYPMAELVQNLQATFRAQGGRVQVLDFFGHTGNFLLESDDHAGDIAVAFSRLLRTPCAVLPIARVAEASAAVQALSPPAKESGLRWTPGAAFHVSGSRSSATPAQTRGACFQRMDDLTILAWKRDQEDARGRLDKRRRGGGWGAVSATVARQLGGVWTARSASTLDGVLVRAEETRRP
jgi:hypothetical protein